MHRLRFSPLREERAGRGRGRGGLLPARSILPEMKFSPDYLALHLVPSPVHAVTVDPPRTPFAAG
jgi:hypothetical protein